MSADSTGSDEVVEVTCPGCYRETDRVLVYEPPVLLFAFVFFAWTHESVAGCPQCVRRRLWRRLAVSLPMSNLAFPITAPLILWDLARSYNEHDRPDIPAEYRGWANPAPPPPGEAEPDGKQRDRSTDHPRAIADSSDGRLLRSGGS